MEAAIKHRDGFLDSEIVLAAETHCNFKVIPFAVVPYVFRNIWFG
jgi:hypothetical protein